MSENNTVDLHRARQHSNFRSGIGTGTEQKLSTNSMLYSALHNTVNLFQLAFQIEAIWDKLGNGTVKLLCPTIISMQNVNVTLVTRRKQNRPQG